MKVMPCFCLYFLSQNKGNNFALLLKLNEVFNQMMAGQGGIHENKKHLFNYIKSEP